MNITRQIAVRNTFARTTILGFLLGLALAVSAGAQGIFKEANRDSLKNNSFSRTMVEERSNALRSRYVQLDVEQLSRTLDTKKTGVDVLEFNLFSDVNLLAKVDAIEHRGDIFTIHGEIDAEHFGRARLTVSDVGVLGQVHVDDRMFEIVLLENGLSAVVEVDLSLAPKDEDFVPVAPSQPAPSKALVDRSPIESLEGRSTPFGPQIAEIDLLLVLPLWYYFPFCTSPALADALAADYEASLDTYMDWSGFMIPGFSIDWNVIVDCQSSVLPSGDLSTDLDAIDTDPTINALRDLHHADMVSMLVLDGGNSAGIGWYSRNGVGKNWAYSVVVQSYALSNYSLHHELGHNMGMNHNRGNADDNVATYCSYGKKLRKTSNNSVFGRTIMSYGSKTRYPIFSNPFITGVNGTSTTAGVACSVQSTSDSSGSAYNTDRLLQRAPTVANFR